LAHLSLSPFAHSGSLVFKYSLSDEFYSLFYLALFNEARNVPAKAELYLRQALATRYAQESSTSSDYMVSCARVHAQLRGWS